MLRLEIIEHRDITGSSLWILCVGPGELCLFGIAESGLGSKRNNGFVAGDRLDLSTGVSLGLSIRTEDFEVVCSNAQHSDKDLYFGKVSGSRNSRVVKVTITDKFSDQIHDRNRLVESCARDINVDENPVRRRPDAGEVSSQGLKTLTNVVAFHEGRMTIREVFVLAHGVDLVGLVRFFADDDIEQLNDISSTAKPGAWTRLLQRINQLC